MLEGFFGSFVAKIVYSVATAVGLFGGLAVIGVLPVIGDNAADVVLIDAIAIVDTPDQQVAVNPYLVLPTAEGVAQVAGADELTESLPDVDGIVSNSTSGGSGLPAVSLLGILLSSATGTVDAGLASLPVVNRLAPAVPAMAQIALPYPAADAPGLDLVADTLYSVPSTVASVALPAGGNVSGAVESLPLAGELLRTAQGAVYALVPGLLVIVE